MHVKDIQINNAVFKKKRETIGLTTWEVAERNDAMRTTVSNIELGKYTPDGVSPLSMMFFFDLSEEDIVIR